MADDLRERVAKAVYNAMAGIGGGQWGAWESQIHPLRERYLLVAQALISAGYIRDPKP